MASEKMKYILRRAEQSALRTDIELSPLKKEIESIFNPRNIDTDCNMISSLSTSVISMTCIVPTIPAPIS